VSATRALASALLAGAAALTAGCAGPERSDAWVELSGEALGTTWHVRVRAAADGPDPQALAGPIREELEAVDARMSGWREASELSRFNASGSTGWFAVSDPTAHVVAEALAVHRLSGGAFDPTVGPLVAAWGFGPAERRTRPPQDAALAAALRRVDAAGLAVRREPPALRKARPDLVLDLAGVAKGYAVDAVARRLRALGVRDALVEVGGELRAHGAGPDGGAWRVAVEEPLPGARRPAWVLDLEDEALATSGDYRERFRWKGRRYGHVLDPRTGHPVSHGLVSVSVVAPEAARADAWATALLVLGREAGRRVAEREGLAVLFVSRADHGATDADEEHDAWTVYATPAMQRRRVAS